MEDFFDRLWKAARLDPDLYKRVASDPEATVQAYLAVVCYSVALTLGAFGRTGLTGINISLITTLFSWYIWAFFTYFLGTRIFKAHGIQVERKAALRALAFACAPGILMVLGLVPGVAFVIMPAATLWMLVAWVHATKVVFGLQGTGRAVLISLIAWGISTMVQLSLFILLFSVFGASPT